MDMEKHLAAQEKRRAQVRESKARHDARMKEMTKLEQAAWHERKSVGENVDPYTARERHEAESLRAEMELIYQRARMLNQEIALRLSRESKKDEGKAMLYARFCTMPGERVELPAF